MRIKPIFTTYIFPKTMKIVFVALLASVIPIVIFSSILSLPWYSIEIFGPILGTVGAIAFTFLGEKQEYYRDSIKLSEERSPKGSITFAEIQSVRYWGRTVGKRKAFQFDLTYVLDGKDQHLKIMTNPTNREQKIDLFTWLKSKVADMQEITSTKSNTKFG